MSDSQVLITHTGRRLELGARIAQGGEGALYEIRNFPGKIVKRYHDGHATPEKEEKIRAMRPCPPPPSYATTLPWPEALVFDGATFVGYVMPKITGTTPLDTLYSASDRLQISWQPAYHSLCYVARNICAIVSTIHNKGVVIGDLKASNILVYPNSQVALVDSDSFQIPGRNGQVHFAHVGTPEYLPPELQGVSLRGLVRTKEEDLWSLAIMLHFILYEGYHPFSGKVPWYWLNKDRTLEELITAGTQPIRPKWAVPKAVLPPLITDIFDQAFIEGHRNPARRPSAETWRDAFDSLLPTLIRCPTGACHWHFPHQQCPWCIRAKTCGVDVFPDQVP